MSTKITLQTKIDKKLNKEFNKCAQEKGQAKWIAIERGMQLYIKESEKEKGKI